MFGRAPGVAQLAETAALTQGLRAAPMAQLQERAQAGWPADQ